MIPSSAKDWDPIAQYEVKVIYSSGNLVQFNFFESGSSPGGHFLQRVSSSLSRIWNVEKNLSKCSYLTSFGHYFVQKLNIQRSIFLPDSHHMGHMSSNNFLLRRTFSELPRGTGDCIRMTEQTNCLTWTAPLKKRNRLTRNFSNKVTFTKVLTDTDKIYNVTKKSFQRVVEKNFSRSIKSYVCLSPYVRTHPNWNIFANFLGT